MREERGGEAGVARIGCMGGEARCDEKAGEEGGNALALNEEEATRVAPSRELGARGGEVGADSVTLRLAKDD